MNYYNLKPKERLNTAVNLLNRDMTYQEVADSMGLTLSQVKYLFKIHTQAGNKLRHVEHGKIKRMIEIFKDEPACSFTAYQVSSILKLSVRTVNHELQKLYSAGLVDRVFQGHYQYNGDNNEA